VRPVRHAGKHVDLVSSSFSMASDRDQFCFAVRTIYESANKEERARAEQWLETWQRQSSAWETAARVLDDANSTDDERFMAAQTLRTKARPFIF
jgi:ferric-dicitrate binding protein FerR (iron transport regulator)